MPRSFVGGRGKGIEAFPNGRRDAALMFAGRSDFGDVGGPVPRPVHRRALSKALGATPWTARKQREK